MRVLTILGTRPEIIRLSRVIPLLDQVCEHRVLHTGQNYDERLNEIFFRELQLRPPDQVLETRAQTPMQQISAILTGCEQVLADWRPQRVLLLGDTNSALAAFVAKRMGIGVLHMEAGNRCYDDRVPEEVNRRMIDHASDVLMPYSERSRANLLREGIAGERIFVTGNPIFEVLQAHAAEIDASPILDTLQLQARAYFLVTLHREENVDVPERLQAFATALGQLADRYGFPVICSTHPRTRKRLEAAGIGEHTGIRWMPPFGLFDFVRLEQQAFCVLSDSGTVQEECCIFKVPSLSLRDVTERPETLEAGSNLLTGADPERILAGVALVTSLPPEWQPPPEYLQPHVSRTVARLVTNFHHGLR
ncbi:MAG TPA: UDP-N-acetylglucosamine 2-epimerase (non-hydrolyzing) [Candidatus Obscuribacterales bacterium]